MPTRPDNNSVAVEDWTPRYQNTLRGFCTVGMPSRLVFHELVVHRGTESSSAAQLGKLLIGRYRTHARDEVAGRLEYVPVVNFGAKELHANLSDAVIAAVMAAHPTVLS